MSRSAVLERPETAPENVAMQAVFDEVEAIREMLEDGKDLVLSQGERSLAVSPSLAAILRRSLHEFSGPATSAAAKRGLLTTQQAADLVGCSRSFLLKEIAGGRLACEWSGTHRRIRTEVLEAYLAWRGQERNRVLAEAAKCLIAAGLYED